MWFVWHELMVCLHFAHDMADNTTHQKGDCCMTTRRKSIGRGDEAVGPIMSANASQAMARGAKVDQPHRHGTPKVGKYSRKLGGEYGSSVSHLQ